MSRDQDCALCVLPGMWEQGGCAYETCGAELDRAMTCLRICAARIVGEGGSYDACLQRDCPAEREALYGCVEPALAAGACDAVLGACGVPP
jgi:hypothetical protein